MTDATNNLKRISWQSENCLSCKWFSPSDPINADILTNGRCVHPELQKFNLIISGRDWCNLFDEISQEQIDQMQEKAMEKKDNNNHIMIYLNYSNIQGLSRSDIAYVLPIIFLGCCFYRICLSIDQVICYLIFIESYSLIIYIES